jgi:hypothetical protein
MTSGRLYRAAVDNTGVAGIAGRLYRAEETITAQVNGRLYRAELTSAVSIHGILYRAEIDSVVVSQGRLYRAEISAASQPVQVHSSHDGIPVEPGDTVTLFGTGGDSPFTSRGWTQTDGPAVTLTGATTATATFVAPALVGLNNLSFQYAVDGAAADIDLDLLGASERRFRGGIYHPLLPQTA